MTVAAAPAVQTVSTESATRALVSMSLQRQRDRSQDLLRLLDDCVAYLLDQARMGPEHIDDVALQRAANILATLQKLDFELFMRIGRGQDEEQVGVDDEQYRREALAEWERDRHLFRGEPADSPAP